MKKNDMLPKGILNYPIFSMGSLDGPFEMIVYIGESSKQMRYGFHSRLWVARRWMKAHFLLGFSDQCGPSE